MSVQVTTRELIGMLAALTHTASDDPEAGSIAGVLLHSARGYLSSEPGRCTLLVGTSTNTVVVGHTAVLATGHAPPMLLPITEVPAVLAVLRSMAKKSPEHTVELLQDGDQVTVAEEENLFGAGASYTFDLGDPGKFPASLWKLLDGEYLDTPVTDRDTRQQVPAGVRTDLGIDGLRPFMAIAKARHEPLEVYRYHQRRPLLVAIGEDFIGALMPVRTAEDLDTATRPGAAVYPAELPQPRPETRSPGATSTVDLRRATGLLLASAGDLDAREGDGNEGQGEPAED